MAKKKQAARRSYYEDLGVKRGATGAEIERAYRKYCKEAEHVTAAPDRARESRMNAAYETLGDPQKRAAYDESLVAPRRERGYKGAAIALLGVSVLSAVAVGAFLLQPPPPPPPGTLGPEEIAHKAGLAVNRIDATDMSGKATPLGIAFAIDEGTVATSCKGITPMSVLTLYLPPRAIPVKVAQVDERLGLCKLSARGIGSWPLAITAADPNPGDTVYMTKVNAVGEVGLVEAKVKRVVPSPRGKLVETSVAVMPERQGGPVLDTHGHVIGVALFPHPGGMGEVVRITPDWAAGPRPAEPIPPAAAAAPPAEATRSPEFKTRAEIAEDRRKQLEDAVRRDVPGT